MASNRESLSAQSKKRTNYLLLVLGIVFLLIFLLAWCSMKKPKPETVIQREVNDYTYQDWDSNETSDTSMPNFGSRGDAQLTATPTEVDTKVVIGGEAEVPIVLRADNAPVILLKKSLAEQQEEGFVLSGPCMEKDRLAKDEDCVLKVSWAPKKIRSIQNTLTILWREDSHSVYGEEKMNIFLKAQSTDSKDCVICCEEKEKEKERLDLAISPKGEPIDPKDPDLKRNKDGLLTGPDGEIKGIAEPEKAPLNLKNELMGNVAPNGDVINKDGKVVGRLLLDNTIIDPSTFAVIGKAVYLSGAMNEHGHIFAKLTTDGSNVVATDAKGAVVGYARVDGQVINPEGKPIGFIRPWGGVIDSMGNFMGVILPDGSVLNGSEKRVAFMRPMGFAVDEKGSLVGGISPRGTGVGAGCRSLGEVSLNGEVKDSFGQIVGHALLDGSIVDNQMNELGSVVRQGIIINAKGKSIGYVNSEGKAVDFKGAVIGCVNPDKTVFAHKKFVGIVMPKGQITKGKCSKVGSVYPDGSVVDLSLNKLGYIAPNGWAYNNEGKELGAVVPWGTAIAEGCRLLGVISLNGDVVSTDGIQMGCVNPDKTVQNLQGKISGKVTPLGLFTNEKNQVIGRVQLDGQIVNNKGEVVGCSYEVSEKPGFVSRNIQGVIVDENGIPVGGTSLGNRAYDESGNFLGNVYFNGWVIGDKGRLIGVVPFSGTIFSDKGQIIGSYNQLTGTIADPKKLGIARVLPGLSVVNTTGTEILGKLIPEGTTFVKTDGSLLGKLSGDGIIVLDGIEVKGTIHANGTVTNNEGNLIGGAVSVGPVLSGAGKYVGVVLSNGEVIDNSNSKIGRVLPNGLVISNGNTVLGQVFPELSVAVSGKGFVGSVEPKMIGEINNASYQLQVNDSRGNLVGHISGTGTVFGGNNSVVGRLVPISTFVSNSGKLIGWSNFKGEVNDPDGHAIGTILPSGSAFGSTQNLMGQVVQNIVAVDTVGQYLGHINSVGQILSKKGEVIATLGTTRFLYNSEGMIVGQVLKPGVMIDNNGAFSGWTRYDGQIENGSKILGQVGLDGHVFDTNGQIIGHYFPLGVEAFSDKKSVGIVADSAEIIDPSGLNVAQTGFGPFIASKGSIVGRLIDEDLFVTTWDSGLIFGITTEDGSVMPLISDKSNGMVKTNGQFEDISGHVLGGLTPLGLVIAPTLGVIGEELQDGQIYKGNKKTGITTGAGLVYSPKGDLIGGVFKAGTVIDKKGVTAGITSGTPSVVFKGKQIGNRMAFRSVLSASNEWLGNVTPVGGIVDAYGAYQGVISLDGSVIGKQNTFVGRILPDGSVAGVPEKAVFNTMPYVGHTIMQGIPVGLNKDFRVVGKTTVSGDVEDNSSKKLFRITDNGYVVNTKQKPPVVAKVYPFISAVDNKGDVMGTVAPDGTIVSFKGEIKGRVDNNGLIRLNNASTETDELKIQGVLIPEDLVVNNCKIVGQTAYDGTVINGQGSVVGRIRRDKWAIDANGAEIGRVVKNNEPCVKGKQYFGRTLPNSIVVDVNGVEIGCATNSGEMVDFNGNVLCTVIERGVIIDKDGNIIGWMLPDATIWDGNDKIGYVDENNVARDWNDNQIGINIADQTIFADDTGHVLYTQGGDDWVHDTNGDKIYQVTPDKIIGVDGQSLCGDLSPYIPGIGCLKGCDLVGENGQKIASLMADGTLRDENGDLYASVLPDGKVLSPSGNEIESFRGLDISSALKQCGMAGASNASAGRHLNIGNRVITVGADGSLVDEDGTIIGYMGEDGRPYTLGNKLMSNNNIDGREPPKIDPIKIPRDKMDEFVDKLAKKRKSMRESFGKGILTISKEIEARAKPKIDKNWEKLGVGRSVSSYKVDMSHVILKGKAIPAVLARSIDSRYADVPALAIVETNIYGEEGRNILIPAGSRLIGQAASGAGSDKVAKIQISWERLIRPDGVAFNLEGAQSGDAQGRGGVAAYLDEQLMEKYGTPILSTLATSAVAYMMATNDAISTTEGGGYNGSGRAVAMAEARKNFIDVIQTILDQMIEDAQNVPPVVYVPSGTRLTVFPQQDLWLRSADDDEEDIKKEFGENSTSAQKPDMGSWVDSRKKNGEEEDSSDSGLSNSEEATPLYDETERMPDISDRKVDPVAQNDEPLF